MAATTQQINDFLTYILYGQSVYMDKVNLKERLGHSDIFMWRLRTNILNNYVRMMVDYFSQDEGTGEYATNNFMTTTEAQGVIDRINKMCDSNYVIAL